MDAFLLGVNMEETSEISLDLIHQSIECSLNDIKGRHKEIDSDLCNADYIKRLVDNVLKPLLQKTALSEVSSMNELHLLFKTSSRRSPSSSIVNSASPPRESCQSSCVNFPKLFPTPPGSARSQVSNLRTRKELLGNVLNPINPNTPVRNGILPPLHPQNAQTKTPSPPRFSKSRESSVVRRRSLRTVMETSMDKAKIAEEVPDIKRIEIRRYLDYLEKAVRILQDTFIKYTQTILVPLQTFCKHGDNTLNDSCRVDENGNNIDNVQEKYARVRSCLDRTEIKIVQTMNCIRRSLWPSKEHPTNSFTEDILTKIFPEIDCEKFSIVCLVPDLLKKFEEALLLASTWRNCDVFYVNNSKAALQRAHKRYLKTEELWQQAKDTRTDLLEEIEFAGKQQGVDSLRLSTIHADLKQLRKELNKCKIAKSSLEERLLRKEENITKLRVKHSSIRKRIILLTSKIEDRDRSYGFLESRVLSTKADQEALSEKLRISENYVNDLQIKMDNLYNVRNDLSIRYEKKTDPDVLCAKLQQAKLRIPIPELREKVFVFSAESFNQCRIMNSSTNREGVFAHSNPQEQLKSEHRPLPSIPLGKKLSGRSHEVGPLQEQCQQSSHSRSSVFSSRKIISVG